MNIFKHPVTVFMGLVLLNGCRAMQDDVTIGEATDDVRITTEVKAAFVADDDLDALDINVDSIDGVVTLNGVVDEQATIAHASAVAADVPGVRSVQNNLTVDQ